MKTTINHSAKRALSLFLALVMLVGTLFTANVGVNIKANAETSSASIADLKISYWEGDFDVQSNGFDVTSKNYINETDAKGTSGDPIIIDDAKELATLVRYGTFKSTSGYYFKLSDAIDVIILQPSNVVDAAKLIGISSAEETRKYFEEEVSTSGLKDWGALCNNGTFAGNFDGNGVEIYGLYVPSSNNTYQNVGLFGGTDPGNNTANGEVGTNNDTGVTYKNIIIKNSYYYGIRRMGGIVAMSNGPKWGGCTNGIYYFDSCVVANCYMRSIAYLASSSTTYSRDCMGIFMGSTDGSDTAIVTNCLAYGNDAENICEQNAEYKGPFALVGATQVYTDTKGVEHNGSISNTVAIGTAGCIYNRRLSSDNYHTNIYTDTNIYNTPGVTQLYDDETTKGATGMKWMDLDWGNKWFAVEGEYPTPIKPDNWDNSITASDNYYSDGEGTRKNPYIIRSVDQLHKMVEEHGITNGVKSYYKVDDDIKELYINKATTHDEIVALVNSGKYNNWIFDSNVNDESTCFKGNFDGNGVTIYGMASVVNDATKVGFVPIFGSDTEIEVTIKNVKFVGAYIKGRRVGTVASDVQSYSFNGDDVRPRSYITNVAVLESYIQAIYNSTEALALPAPKTTHNTTAGGILAMERTPDHIILTNCLFDGGSSSLIDPDGAEGNHDGGGKAGILSVQPSNNEYELINCVSIDEYLLPMIAKVANITVPAPVASRAGYYRYASEASGSSTAIHNSYSLMNADIDDEYLAMLEILAGITELSTKNTYKETDMPSLDWANTWQLVKLSDGRTIPMPTGIAGQNTAISLSEAIASVDDGNGANKLGGNGYAYGTYGMYHKFIGSGTEEDPYLITSALELAQAIACGGKNVNRPLYYKLTRDIDLESAAWIDQTKIGYRYTYVPFEGILDGADHIISGLAAFDATAAGLVPVLNGGTIKNIHIRNSYAGSNGVAGLIAGHVKSGTIKDCSVEKSVAVNSTNSTIIGGFDAGAENCIQNSYAVVGDIQIFSENASRVIYPDAGAEWYMGPDGVVRSLAVAKAHTVTDIDGDGIFEAGYTTNDIAALRNNLLGEEDFAHIYGDVNNDGKTNISDLAVLRRELAGTYNSIKDGFWRNLETGKISIYYGSNDNYDAARKLELALEAKLPGVDIKKVVSASTTVSGNTSNKNAVYVHANDEIGTPDGKLEIIVGDIPNYTAYKSSNLGTNNYAVTYNSTNQVVWLKGGSFTGVEQAVNEFIASSSPLTGNVYTTAAKTLVADKQSITVDGSPYYYAWGDEFNGTEVDMDKWAFGGMHNETDKNETGTSYRHKDLEVAFPEDMDKLYAMDGSGALTIWRGYYSNKDIGGNQADIGDLSWGYKYLGKLSDKGVTSTMTDPTTEDSVVGEHYISNKYGGRVESTDIYATAGKIDTQESVLAKQGYLEMKVTYPSDGHVFACWWLMGFNGGQKNNVISDSLFGKAFKLNNAEAYDSNTAGAAQYAWDGSNTMDSRDPSTFKYILPNSTFEIDIAELMQSDSSMTSAAGTTGHFTFHKFYRNGIYSVTEKLATDSSGNAVNATFKKVKFINWDNVLSGSGSMYHSVSVTDENSYTLTEEYNKIYGDYGIWNQLSKTTDKSGSVTYDEFYTNRAIDSSTDHILYNKDANRASKYAKYGGAMLYSSGDAGNYFSGTPGTVQIEAGTEYIFGVKWDATNTSALYTFYVKYASTKANVIEPIVVAEDILFNEEKNTSGNYKTYLSNLSKIATDQSNANQYMYMLIDNTYYTSSNSSSASPYTDLLTNSSSNKTAQMIIDYVRIYQNKRDLITPETEAFNNGNHFGY